MFVFSFDNGCVMFCGAALEQTLRKALGDVASKRCRNLKQLIEKASCCKLLCTEGAEAAHNLRCTRNHVIHSPFMVEGEDLKNEALNAMKNLGKVLESLDLKPRPEV